MTGGEALVGFALVFVVTSWTLSAALAAGLAAAGGAVRRLGPAAERRVATVAAIVPAAVAAAVVTTMVVRAVAGADHCSAHDHHAHLCLTHGDGWTDRPWVVALVAAAAAIIVARLAVLGGALVRARRQIARLRAVSVPRAGVRLVDSPRPFGFVAGLRRPEIFVSSAAWDGLSADERAAMLAHERGHVRHGDVARRAALEAVAAFGAPLTPAPLLARWEHATERLRDRDAVDAVGAPEVVASAMVRLCRLGAAPAATRAVGFPAAPGALDDRVHALLADAPRGERAARVVARSWLVGMLAAAIAIAALAEPLHHALESVLG